MTERIKDFLNEQANARLSQLGYSDAMIRDSKREAWWWLQARGRAVRKRTRLLAASAVVWTSPGRTELVRVDVPAAIDGEVTLEMLTSVVSTGTERAQYLRLPNTSVSYPYRPGYSGAGVVVAAGSNTNLRPGDIVAARNVPHTSVVTAPAQWVHLVPPDVAPEAAAMLQLGIIGLQGVRRASIQVGEPVCIVGAGLVGLLAQRLAIAQGSGAVTVIGRSEAKRAVATVSDGSRFLVSEAHTDEIAALASPIVIDATGDPNALWIAAQAAAAGGRIVLLGSPRGSSLTMPLAELRSKRLRLIGAHIDTLSHESRAAGVDLFEQRAQAFLEHLATKRLFVSDLLNVVVDPREADAFYRRLATARDIVAARFDWALLPQAERVAARRLVALPDLSGRGMNRRKPLPANGRHRRRTSRAADVDPFADASGRLRLGILGCGDIAVLNAEAIHAAPNVELVACYDPVRELAEGLADRYAVEAVRTSGALLERDDVDAVVLSVPHHLHAPLGDEAASAGKHVIVEKPLANDLRAAVALANAAERAGVALSVCFPHRYQPSVQLARRLIAAGAVGDIQGVLVHLSMDKPPSYWLGGYSGRAYTTWRSSRAQAGGGVLIMNLSHYVDLVWYLTGAEAASVAATSYPPEIEEVEEAISVAARSTNGALQTLTAGSSLRGSEIETEFRLWGSEGQILLEPSPIVYTCRAVVGIRTGRWQRLGPFAPRNERALYFSRFATAIDQGQRPDITATDGLIVQAFIEAAYRSNELGRSMSPQDLLETAQEGPLAALGDGTELRGANSG